MDLPLKNEHFLKDIGDKRSEEIPREKIPGVNPPRQPVHTVYGGAQLFSAQTASKMGEIARKTLTEYAPSPLALMGALDVEGSNLPLWQTVYARVVEKLKEEPVEDFRIDFEDGYGSRPDPEEDHHARSAALELVRGMTEDALPHSIGIRIKPLTRECFQRSLRTLEIFLTTVLSKTQRDLPPHFVVTLPKVTTKDQCAVLHEALTSFEKKAGLTPKILKCEIMVETPQAILDKDGRCPLRSFVDAFETRCVGAHFGTYDYTAGCGITAGYQTMDNPVCDFAKHMMQVALAGLPVFLSDGATNEIPVGPHKSSQLTPAQKTENEGAIHRAWKTSFTHIRHSLRGGFYQGWDLHPAQLPVRFAAVYSFFLENLGLATERLRSFVAMAARATLSGAVFDDAATGQGLLNYFLRALNCGAITAQEAALTGLTPEEIGGRSFVKILERRKKTDGVS